MPADDPKTKPVDCQKLKGYVLKWRDSRMLLGSAYFSDPSKSSSTLARFFKKKMCVHVVTAMKSVIKTSNAGHKLKATRFEDLQTVKKVIGRLSDGDDASSKVYLLISVQLMNYEGSLTFLKRMNQSTSI